MKVGTIVIAGLLGAATVFAAGCGSSSPSTSDTTGGSGDPMFVTVGSGATFPATAYTRWCQESETCTYASKGSGAGIKDLTTGTVAWAGSDAPLTSEETAAITGTVLYFPTLLGAVTVPTNIEGVTGPINLTGTALAGIFDGDITRWNDTAIATDNPGKVLPDAPITVCARSDSSGTSYNFSKYLGTVSPTFAGKVGANGSKTPTWTAKTVGSPGNPGVAQCVTSNPNSIGYVDSAAAKEAGITDRAAAIGTAAGSFVAPTTASITLAGDVASVPSDLLVNVLDSPVAGAYPITTTTYVLAVAGTEAAGTVTMVLTYFLGTKAQGQLAAMGFAPLPANVLAKAIAQLSALS